MADDSALVDRFFSSFRVLDEHGLRSTPPVRVTSEPEILKALYSELPARFPRLYEQCLLSYRWAQLDSGSYRLLGNPPGRDFQGLLENMKRDPALWDALIPNGYLQFGKGPDMDYDPVCFDLNRRRHSGDCPIVKIDHEGILSFNKISIVEELAKSFRDLVECTIDRAQKKTVPQE